MSRGFDDLDRDNSDLLGPSASQLGVPNSELLNLDQYKLVPPPSVGTSQLGYSDSRDGPVFRLKNDHYNNWSWQQLANARGAFGEPGGADDEYSLSGKEYTRTLPGSTRLDGPSRFDVDHRQNSNEHEDSIFLVDEIEEDTNGPLPTMDDMEYRYPEGTARAVKHGGPSLGPGDNGHPSASRPFDDALYGSRLPGDGYDSYRPSQPIYQSRMPEGDYPYDIPPRTRPVYDVPPPSRPLTDSYPYDGRDTQVVDLRRNPVDRDVDWGRNNNDDYLHPMPIPLPGEASGDKRERKKRRYPLRIISLVGGPGSGKTANAARVAQNMGLALISVAEALRYHTSAKTPRGQKIEQAVKKGKLSNQTAIRKTILEEIDKETEAGARGLLLDGFPRTLDQLKWFEKEVAPVRCVIYLQVSGATMEDRTKMRRVRERETEDTPWKRMEDQDPLTRSLIMLYEDTGRLVRISGEPDLGSVSYRIAEEIEKSGCLLRG